MKKTLMLVLALVMALPLLAGCGGNKKPSASPGESEGQTAAAGAVKTGLGAVISIAKSTGATADAAGLAEADVVMAAVTVGADGRIVDVKIDMVQATADFNTAGRITSDTAAVPATKVELGAAYGMASQSSIGKEWYEQIAALEDWMTGKTIEQVAAMKLSAEGTPAEADLTSSVTVHVSDYIKAVQKAVANAQDFGQTPSGATKTGLGSNASLTKSASAKADAEGAVQADNVMAAVTVDSKGVIVGVAIDTAQVVVAIDAAGRVTSDTAAELKTKVELGAAYGMASQSSIGKEWSEQIAALGKWMIGKTIDQVTGMKLDAEGRAAEADLTSGVTIHVSDYIKAVQEAVANAG